MTHEPRWLAKADVVELHDYVLARTGGSPGLRDEGLLESALTRPLNRWSYEGVEDIRELAAPTRSAWPKAIPSSTGTSAPPSSARVCFWN